MSIEDNLNVEPVEMQSPTNNNNNTETGKKDSVSEIVKEVQEAELYSKREQIVQKIQLILLILTVIGYLIYGIIKVTDSYANPATKYSEKSIQTYPYPLTIACMNGTGINESGGGDYYLEVSSIDGLKEICDNNNVDNDTETPLCSKFYQDKMTYSTGDRFEWQIFDSDYAYSEEELLYCVLIVPPSNITISGDKKTGGVYQIRFDVYRQGMFDVDTTFNASIPTVAFIVRQYEFSVDHQAFHIDELYSSFDDYDYSKGDTIDSADLIAIAYETGTSDYYAPACSRNDLEISLSTTKAYGGGETNAFELSSAGAVVDTVMYDSDFGVCTVGLYYYPKSKGKDTIKKTTLFYQSYAEEYLDYDVAALFSGVGGILGTAQAVLGAIIPIILTGLAISLLRIEWKGIAPLPKFDDTFEKKLDRYLRNYLYQHRNSIQNYIK